MALFLMILISKYAHMQEMCILLLIVFFHHLNIKHLIYTGEDGRSLKCFSCFRCSGVLRVLKLSIKDIPSEFNDITLILSCKHAVGKEVKT